MQKYFVEGTFYQLPSGNKYYPSRLIIRDGTLTWKDACRQHIPQDLAHEQHIIKTAQRVEELNTWVSQGRDPWECLKPVHWYCPETEGISICFKHVIFPNKLIYEKLIPHIKPHEELEMNEKYLFFKRC